MQYLAENLGMPQGLVILLPLGRSPAGLSRPGVNKVQRSSTQWDVS